MGEPQEVGVGKVRVKVLDFGLARLLQEQTITSYGLALGTPSFMSPEQAAGRIDEIDGRTDLFALAATGFRLRTGRRIHEGANPVELVTKMAHVAAPRIRTLAPDVSEPFARVVDRALEFRREDRYENASAMRDDVCRAIGELDAGLTATQLAVHALPVTAPPAEPTVQLSEGDFELSQAPPEAPVEPARASEPGPQARPGDWPDESIHIPRRRSVLPWVALLMLGAIGAKLWLDSRSATRAAGQGSGEASAVGSASAVPSPAAPRDGAADVVVQAAHSAVLTPSAARSAPVVASPPASTIRRPTPTNLGPGNGHKPPGTRNAR
jgi:hypothetical protein